MAQPGWWDTMLAAIRAQESGGNYAEDVAGCLGAYCWNAQSNWDNMAAAAGMHQYVGQNPATLPPKVQDQVASANLGQIYGQTHSVARTLEWWNGGQTHSVPNPGLPEQTWAKQCGGGTSAAYACQVMARMKLGGHYLAGAGGHTGSGGSGSGGTVQPSAVTGCLIGIGGIPGTSWIADIFGGGGNLGSVCLLSRSEARGMVGAVLMGVGGAMALPAVLLLVAAVGMSNGKLAGAAEKAGAAVALIPGAEGIGVGITAAGKATRSTAEQTRSRRQGKRAPARRERTQTEREQAGVRKQYQPGREPKDAPTVADAA